MNQKKSTYRVKIGKSGTPPNEVYGWEIYRDLDVLSAPGHERPNDNDRARSTLPLIVTKSLHRIE
jgi:hypothetical protein